MRGVELDDGAGIVFRLELEEVRTNVEVDPTGAILELPVAALLPKGFSSGSVAFSFTIYCVN